MHHESGFKSHSHAIELFSGDSVPAKSLELRVNAVEGLFDPIRGGPRSDKAQGSVGGSCIAGMDVVTEPLSLSNRLEETTGCPAAENPGGHQERQLLF